MSARRVTLIRRVEHSEQDGSRRWLHLTGSVPVKMPEPIYFETKDHVPPTVMDSDVMALLMWAMRNRVELDVDGPMTRQAFSNLNEFQTAVHDIYGEKYTPVEIRPSSIVDADKPPSPRGLSLFSGGVDGIFTLLRHQDERGVKVKTVLMLHHLGLDRHDDFVSRRLARVAPLLDELQVGVLVQKTNLRRATSAQTLGDAGQPYLESFGPQLSASLHQYSASFGSGLIGSSEPYSTLFMAIGSTPATDWMLSNSAMQIIHDGAGFNRSQKVAVIARSETARRVLHVCLKHPYENCGSCMKCVRTRLNFMALGMDAPECMPEKFDLNDIDRLRIKHETAYIELLSILNLAKKNGTTGAWSRRLSGKLMFSGRGSLPSLLRKAAFQVASAVSRKLDTAAS